MEEVVAGGQMCMAYRAGTTQILERANAIAAANIPPSLTGDQP